VHLEENEKLPFSPDYSFFMFAMQGNGLFPAKYKLKDLNPGFTPLDPFHTHFVLVDNGTDNRPGVEIKLRVELEAEIAKQCKMITCLNWRDNAIS